MIVGREFHELIKNIFVDVKGYLESDQIQVNCPLCQEREGLIEPDGKFNLEINTEKGVFRCWKCEDPSFSGTIGKLIRRFGSRIDYELYKSFAGRFQDTFVFDDDEEFIPIFLPPKFISFTDFDENDPDHIEAYKYIVVDRQLKFETVLKYNIGFCLEGKYRKRIIIPSYDINGNVNYFVGRNYDRYAENKPPYDNPKHGKKALIFNERFINYDSVVFLVEGVFDMFTLPNAIPLLGKELNEAIFYRLKQRKPYLVIALDPDARKNEFEIYNQLKNIYGDDANRVRVLDLKGKTDIDEIRKAEGKKVVCDLLRQSRLLGDDDYFDFRLS